MWLITVLEVLFAGAILSLLVDIAGRRYNLPRNYLAWAVCLAAGAVSVTLLVSEWAPVQALTVVQPVSSVYGSLYLVDRFSIFVVFTVLVVGLVATLYSLRYLGDKERPGPYYALMLLLLGSLVGVVSAGDYLTLFLFWEGMSVAAYALVSFGKEQLSLEATMKYFFMAGIGSLLALYGIALIHSVSGSIQLTSVMLLIGPGASAGTLGLAILVIGLGIEAAVVPLHTWLPDVYATAPLPVASVVSGAVTGAAAFAILKVVQPLVPFGGFPSGVIVPPALGLTSASIPSIQILLAALALITMLVGNLSGLVQTNLRRLLSFSSIAQTGYMLAALSTLSVAGLVAVVFTIWNHGLLKSNFFMLLGKERSAFADADLQSLSGVGKQDRPLGFLYASSSLGMVGAPPFGMFWSEILVVQSLLAASTGLFFWLAVAVVVNIIISIGYYYKVINTVVFGEANGAHTPKSVADLAPPALLVLLSLLTGLLPFLFLNMLI